MTSAEKKVVYDQIFALATDAEEGRIDLETLTKRLWKLGNQLRDEAREDATK